MIGQRRREQPQGARALDHDALMRLDATDAIEGVDDGAQRAARRGSDAVGHGIRDAHAARGREDVTVFREAADEVRKPLAVRAHVLLLAPAERRRVLHAALVALPTVDVRPQHAIPDTQWLADRILARTRTERDDGAHHLVAENDRQLRRCERLRHPVPLMDVRAADRGDVHAHEQRAGLEIIFVGDGQFADLDRLAILGHHGGARGLGQVHDAVSFRPMPHFDLSRTSSSGADHG